ncbi:response regulator transcription factor [Halomonas heilongjiangensis]|uniref:DNA-binding response regulator n=1 Tax=Halomonas heilongjiangensis TaxID=1387883 RepID=A0A2N7TTU4_9GAMM|nr:response regulator transcription factor [Halomonas heilongjiangensis]PMR71603.1 DNA-binding response regulator [Halomonas heilongjiangensis]PXX94304.1 helix-turn-helix transcriptional regulator [Halomonas heilongjiangensis]
MAHLFVCQGRDEIPRWREAFPQARLVNPQQARAWAGRGDRIWVMSNLEGWPALVSTLSGRGATLMVLSYAPNSLEAFQALNAGARGYAHALSPAELLRQVEVVTTNQGIWVWPELLAQVVGGTFKALGGESRLQEEILAVLTGRERAVALAVAEGQSNKAVARRLDITERTVKAHLGAVFRKLGVRDRMQLILRLSHQDASVADSG